MTTTARTAAIIAIATALRAAQVERSAVERAGNGQWWTAAEAECGAQARVLSARIR